MIGGHALTKRMLSKESPSTPASGEPEFGNVSARVVPARDTDREAELRLRADEGGWKARWLAGMAIYAEICPFV